MNQLKPPRPSAREAAAVDKAIANAVALIGPATSVGRLGFVPPAEDAAIGAVTNLASRLADEAAEGQILIAQRLYAEVEDAVEVEPVGEFTLKGFNRPVLAFNVVALREELSTV